MSEIRVIQLLCPLCAASGKVEPVETSTDSAWLPALLEKYVPENKRKEGFISLEEAIAKAPQFEALVDVSGRRREAKIICFDHSRDMLAAKIWTTRYSVVLDMRARAAAGRAARIAEEKAERERSAFDSIGSMLAGKQALADADSQGDEPEGDAASAQAIAEQEAVQRKLAADAAAAADAASAEAGRSVGRGRGKGKGSTKGRANSTAQREMKEALAGR
ncbi:MAG TPA: hypothetical protein VI794_03275 [Patescibacteria group bacterium]|nr:hypothetical protein [Patescibacteria group bacterium]